ncbi:single-strand DNA endonuclease ASTE1-like [Parasteatoda tepidariorum]|uniref:single-strand DNA endonuclease ASTE1-like n=1 Tax=Parasteatoda tepidariorum TaxID=114398 RepID=UPI0039BD227E
MTIRGLSKFIDENDICRPFKLRNTQVIIDGCSLIHHIYARNETNCIFGGDYDKFATDVQNYFSILKQCQISPIIIFDGGQTDDKIDMRLKRQQQRTEEIKTLLRDGDEMIKVLPLNSHVVFKNILSEIDVLYVQCDYEGDAQLASIATHYKCPILSEVSDFYIYDLPYGFIKISHIDNAIKVETLRDGSQKKYLLCKIYYLSALLYKFPLKDKTMISLVATLAGNHYVSAYDHLRKFYLYINVRFKDRFQGLFSWLHNQTFTEAKSKVFNLVGHDIRNLIEKSISEYELKPTNMIDILNAILHNQSEDLIVSKSVLILPCGEVLPGKFKIAFHKGLLTTWPLNTITFKCNTLYPQIEDFSEACAFTCSRYIRKVIYGIVLRHGSENSKRHAEICLRQIIEYEPGTYSSPISVEFLSELENGEEVPNLKNLYRMQKDGLRDFMCSVLGLDGNFFSDIYGDLHLLFGCIHYWLLHSSPKPSKEFLSSLMLTIIYLQIKEIITVPNEEINTDVDSRACISQSTIKLVSENLEKYLQKPVLNSTNPFDISIVHSYSQLQACIHDISGLNRLLNLPFKAPQLHKLLNGTMLYNLTNQLQSEKNAESVIRCLLGGEASVIKMYEGFMFKFALIGRNL